MIAKSTSKGISLNEAAERLHAILGEAAPARITLHRHSHDGQIAHAVVRHSKTRKYYDLDLLIRHYERTRGTLGAGMPAASMTAKRYFDHDQWSQQESHSKKELPAPLINPQEAASTLVSLLKPMIEREVAQVLAPISQTLARVDRGLNDLAATRTALMLKYDSAATLSTQRLEAAQAEIDKLKRGSDTDQQLMRIRMDLGRLIDAINSKRA